MSLKNRQCWICGAKDQSTGEHMIQKADLKRVLGSGPYYYNSDVTRNCKIQGPRSDKFKSTAPICADCNNAKTQPFDKAWDIFSRYFDLHPEMMKPGKTIKLQKIFPGYVHKEMLNIHLFFIKKFGCRIQEANIPIDMQSFSSAILNKQPHPKVYIAICPPMMDKFESVGFTDIETIFDNFAKRIDFAVWYYELRNLSVRIIYSEQKKGYEGLKNTWHPSTVGKIIRISDF